MARSSRPAQAAVMLGRTIECQKLHRRGHSLKESTKKAGISAATYYRYRTQALATLSRRNVKQMLDNAQTNSMDVPHDIQLVQAKLEGAEVPFDGDVIGTMRREIAALKESLAERNALLVEMMLKERG